MRCATSAVVVDFPLVPVIATSGDCGAQRRRSRQNSSMSPITSTAAARASPTGQCGAGWVSGTPGASTSAEILDQSSWRKSAVGTPALVAFATASALSSQPTTSAPPASSALALASPDPPSPKSATFFPANVVIGIKLSARSSQLESREAGKRKHHRYDPESNDDLRLCPSQLLEMVMDGRHSENPLSRELVRCDLHDHRHRFQHEQPADHGQHDLVLRRYRDGADHAAKCQRAGVAHENRSRRRIEPKKSQACTDHCAANNGKLSGPRNIVNVQILGEEGVADQIRDKP